MENFHVSLPLRYIWENEDYLRFFLHNRLCPELGVDAFILDEVPESWHRKVSTLLEKEGLATAVHLPFIDIHAGSPDSLVREAAEKRLVRGVETAMLYKPQHMIAHNGYNPAGYADFYPRWLENAVATWTSVDQVVDDCPVYLENTVETEPSQIKDVLGTLSDRFGFCFDIGHWFSFSRGWENKDLSTWLQSFGPNLDHLHLHDNDGSDDQHLGMGRGNIPFVEFFAGIEFMELSPGVTLEPHTYEDLEQSIRFMSKHKKWFSLLGLPLEGISENPLSSKESFTKEN